MLEYLALLSPSEAKTIKNNMHIVVRGRMLCITFWCWESSEAGQQGREEMSLVSVCSHEFRKLHTEAAESVDNTLESKEIFVSVRCWGWRESVWRRSHLSSRHSTQTDNACCHLIFHRKLFSPKKKFGCVWWGSDLCKVLNVWLGLRLGSTSKTHSDHHPKAHKPFVDSSVNHFDFSIFESSHFEYIRLKWGSFWASLWLVSTTNWMTRCIL